MYAKLDQCPFFLNRVVGACGVFLNNPLIDEVHSSPGARGAGVPAVGLDSLSIAKKVFLFIWSCINICGRAIRATPVGMPSFYV